MIDTRVSLLVLLWLMYRVEDESGRGAWATILKEAGPVSGGRCQPNAGQTKTVAHSPLDLVSLPARPQ